MKKSELKEMIRQAMLEEVQSIPPHLYISNPDGRMDSPKRMINRYLGNLGVDTQNPLATNNKHYVEGVRNIEVMMSDGRYEEADQYAGEIADKISMLPTLEENEGKKISEAEEDKKDKKEEEEDIEIEDIEGIEGIEDTEEIEDIPSLDASGITGDEKKVQDSLESALIAAKELGDEKLINQIGNSITFFTRSHVVGSGEESLDEEIEGDNNGTQMSKTIDSLSRMITPMDSAEGIIQWVLDNPDDLPEEVDEDFFYDNLDQIEQKLTQMGKEKEGYDPNFDPMYNSEIDYRDNLEEAYERKKMLKIAGIIK